MKPAIGVFGVSGVGKTFLISGFVRDNPEFIHVQASSLIKTALKNSKLTSENLRSLNPSGILENQGLLAAAFATTRENYPDKFVLLDAHSVIDSDNGLIHVSCNDIAGLRLSHLVFLRDSPESIISRRAKDAERLRPNRTQEQIAHYQSAALDQCQSYARQLQMPLNLVSPDDSEGFSIALKFCWNY